MSVSFVSPRLKVWAPHCRLVVSSQDTGRKLRPFVIAMFFWPPTNTLSLLKIFCQWKVIRHCCKLMFFFARSQQQGLERMMMRVSVASTEYGPGQEPQLWFSGAWVAAQNVTPVVTERFVSEGKLRVTRRAEGAFLAVGWVGRTISSTSQLARTGSRCRAAAGKHLGRASGSPLHI